MTGPQHEVSLLSERQPGDRVQVVGVDTDKALKKRLLSMGIANQSRFQVLQRRGHAVVLGNATSRIAIGSGMSEKILVKTL